MMAQAIGGHSVLLENANGNSPATVVAVVRRIARTASLSRALLYVYFKDKAAIQRGIMLRAGQSLVARFEQARGTEQDGLAQIRAMGEAYYRFYLEQPDYFSALTKASTAMAEADERQAKDMLCSKAALYLRGALHGVILLCQAEMAEGAHDFPADTLIRHTMDMLTSSIRA